MYFLNFLLSQKCIDCFKQTNTESISHYMYTNQNNYLQYSCQVVIPEMIFFFNSIPPDLFYLNIHIVILL